MRVSKIMAKGYSLGKSAFILGQKLPFSRRLTCFVAKRSTQLMWRSIIIEPFNVCNLRCKMCPYVNTTRKKVQMSMKLFQQIIDDARRNEISSLSLSNYNEPLLDDLLFDRIIYAKSRGMKVGFFTNGTLLTEDKIPRILEQVDWITFSFDGATRQTYEKIRIGADFEKTKDNILRFINERKRRNLRKPFIGISFVKQKDNLHEIMEFRQFWSRLVDRVFIEGEVNRLEVFASKESKTKLRLRPFPCARIPLELNVMSNGTTPLCCVDFNGSFLLGDLNVQTIVEIRSSAIFKEVMGLHVSGKGDSIRLCKVCDSLYTEGYKCWLILLSQAYPLSRLAKYANPYAPI